MNEHREAVDEANGRYGAFDTKDSRLVIYEPGQSDAWIASAVRTSIAP